MVICSDIPNAIVYSILILFLYHVVKTCARLLENQGRSRGAMKMTEDGTQHSACTSDARCRAPIPTASLLLKSKPEASRCPAAVRAGPALTCRTAERRGPPSALQRLAPGSGEVPVAVHQRAEPLGSNLRAGPHLQTPQRTNYSGATVEHMTPAPWRCKIPIALQQQDHWLHVPSNQQRRHGSRSHHATQLRAGGWGISVQQLV